MKSDRVSKILYMCKSYRFYLILIIMYLLNNLISVGQFFSGCNVHFTSACTLFVFTLHVFLIYSHYLTLILFTFCTHLRSHLFYSYLILSHVYIVVICGRNSFYQFLFCLSSFCMLMHPYNCDFFKIQVSSDFFYPMMLSKKRL